MVSRRWILEYSRIMDHHSNDTPHQDRVTALFGDHELSFDLEPGTTLVQLAERLAELARQNHGWPMGITVLFDTAVEPVHRASLRQAQGIARVGQGL